MLCCQICLSLVLIKYGMILAFSILVPRAQSFYNLKNTKKIFNYLNSVLQESGCFLTVNIEKKHKQRCHTHKI